MSKFIETPLATTIENGVMTAARPVMRGMSYAPYHEVVHWIEDEVERLF